MRKFFAQRKLNILCSAVAILLIFAVWIVAFYIVKNDLIVPSVAETFMQIGNCFVSAVFWRSFGGTLLRTLYAFIASFLLASVFAAFSEVSRIFGQIAATFISILRTLPTLAITLILLLWAGSSAAPVIVTSLVLFPMIYSQFTAALGGIDAGLKEMAKVYNLTGTQKLFKIYLPQVSPNVLSQVGADISMGLKITVSAEVLSYTLYSIGYLMQRASVHSMALLAALTLVCIFSGLIIEIVCYNLHRITAKWAAKESGE